MRLTGKKGEAVMKIVLSALAFAALLIPVGCFAHDYDRGYTRQSRVQENFERDHPRRPRIYCHTHRFPLNGDDTRRHCHNWNLQSWEAARQRLGGVSDGWYDRDRRSDRWQRDRLGSNRDRRGGWWDRVFD
jgi:hypothetical protein